MDGSLKITEALRQLAQGRSEVLDRLIPMVYDELRRIAPRHPVFELTPDA